MVVSGDGLVLFRQWFPESSLAAVHVYFPDPWWKKRHKKRRVLNAVLRDVERTLVAGGRLHFWTDVEEYFRTTLELIAATVKLEGPLSVHERPAERRAWTTARTSSGGHGKMSSRFIGRSLRNASGQNS